MDYNEEAEYVTADELAECYRVGEELYIKLWEVTIANQKKDTRSDNGPRGWLEEAPNLLSKVWSAFTIDEKSKINDALENGPWSMTQQLDQREEQGL